MKENFFTLLKDFNFFLNQWNFDLNKALDNDIATAKQLFYIRQFIYAPSLTAQF